MGSWQGQPIKQEHPLKQLAGGYNLSGSRVRVDGSDDSVSVGNIQVVPLYPPGVRPMTTTTVAMMMATITTTIRGRACIKRVASAVGEGSTAISIILQE